MAAEAVSIATKKRIVTMTSLRKKLSREILIPPETGHGSREMTLALTASQKVTINIAAENFVTKAAAKNSRNKTTLTISKRRHTRQRK